MYLKIYFDDKPVYLCNEIDTELKEILHHPDAIFIDEVSAPAIKSLLHEIKKEAFHAGVLLHKDLDALKKDFFKQFDLIEAAGGIVQNDQKQMLFIYRLNKWDLPKGKVEKGENFEQAAIREVEEETGVNTLQLKKTVSAQNVATSPELTSPSRALPPSSIRLPVNSEPERDDADAIPRLLRLLSYLRLSKLSAILLK